MKLVKLLWNFLLMLTVYAVFRENAFFKKTIILIFEGIRQAAVYIINETH